MPEPPPAPTSRRLGLDPFARQIFAVTGSFVVALVLAAVVVVRAILAWREERTRGGLWGLIAVAMAASDRIFLALFSALGGF